MLRSRVPRLLSIPIGLACTAAVVAMPAGAAAATDLLVQGPNFTVDVASAGGIDSVVFSDGRTWDLGGGSLLTDGGTAEACTATAAAQRAADNGVTWASRCVGPDGRRTDLVEQLTPTATSISWTLTTKAEAGTYSSGIATKLSGFSDDHTRLFWTASGQSATSWQDPLRPAPFADMSLPYGGHALKPQNGFSLPLATIVEPDTDHSLSLVQSPRDDILHAQLNTTTSGDIEFVRTDNRITTSRPVVFHMNLIAGAADWRGALGWMAANYPTFFTTNNPAVERLAGFGSYSAFPGPFTPTLREKMRSQDFRTNWELSLHGPYFGEYIPPVTSPEETWPNYIAQSGEAPGPANASVQSLRDETQRWSDAGFEQLAYFNTTEFGDKNTQTAQAPSNLDCSASELWRKANEYLYCNFAHAILRDASGNPTFSYFGSVVMDNGDPAYQQHLLDQAKALMTQLPAYAGINIDRMDWLDKFNLHADDGISWYQGSPARSLITSWKELLGKLTAEMHAAGKQVWVSPTDAKRIDELEGIDGIQSEFNNDNAAMNMDAFLGLERPVIGWNYGASDSLLQHYLYMGVFPQSDIPSNDHGIAISAATDQLYRDYGLMFAALKGKKWVLTPHPVSVNSSSALANIFTTPDGVVVPVILGGTSPSATVGVTDLDELMSDLDVHQAEYLTPGAKTWTAVPTTKTRNITEVNVPLGRGTALVRFPTHAEEAGQSHLSQDPLKLSLSVSGQWATSTNAQTVSATLRNQSPDAINQIQVSISAPSGWSLTRTDAGVSMLSPGEAATLTWQVHAPDTQAGSVAEIRPRITYNQDEHEFAATDAVRVVDGVAFPASQMSATATTSLGGNPPSNAIDNDPATFWHSQANNSCTGQSLTIDLGHAVDLAGLAYLPRQDGSQNGEIHQYAVYASTDGTNFTAVARGTFKWDMGLQTVEFNTTAQYLRLESLSGYGPWASAAEVTPIVASSTLTRDAAARETSTPSTTTNTAADLPITCAAATSAQPGYGAANAIDHNVATLWHTSFAPYQPLPQSITLRLDKVRSVDQISYLPRQDGYPNGNILTYNLYTSSDGQNWTLQASGSWADDSTLKVAAIPPTEAAFVRLEATSGDGGWASAAEISVQGT